MATIASKIQWTTAAFAVAAAATLVPIAFADPTDSDTDDTTGAAVGSAAGQAPTRSNRKDRTRVNDAAVAAQTDTGASGSSDSPAGSPTGGSATNNTGTRDSIDITLPNSASPNPAPNSTSPSANAQVPLAVGDDVTIIEVPLIADPDLQAATFGWMQNLNIDACVLGLSQRITGQQSVIGPYGTSSLSYRSSGCA